MKHDISRSCMYMLPIPQFINGWSTFACSLLRLYIMLFSYDTMYDSMIDAMSRQNNAVAFLWWFTKFSCIIFQHRRETTRLESLRPDEGVPSVSCKVVHQIARES